MFGLLTLENLMFVLNHKNTLKNVFKDMFDTTKHTINKGLYALSIGLTSLGVWGITTVLKNVYYEKKSRGKLYFFFKRK